MALKEFVISKLIRGFLNDPVYKDYYVMQSVLKNGDIILSPVMSHENYMIYEAGLRSKTLSGEIKSFSLLGTGGEEDMFSLYDQELQYLINNN